MKLTIAMATHSDYEGLFMTIQSLKMYHPICMTDEVEFLVIDTNHDSAHGKAVEGFCKSADVKYVTSDNEKGAWIKYAAVEVAEGDVVIVLDCHVLLHSGAVQAVLDYYGDGNSQDMLQGPCVFDCLKAYGTHFDPVWRDHDFGTWGTNKEAYQIGEPFSIPMMGMGCFAIRRDAWQGISPDFKGFGSEEWYMAETVRSWGGDVKCLPQFKWTHRWGRPGGVPYPYSLDGKIYNYAVGWKELYGINSPQFKSMVDHFGTILPKAHVEKIVQSVP